MNMKLNNEFASMNEVLEQHRLEGERLAESLFNSLDEGATAQDIIEVLEEQFEDNTVLAFNAAITMLLNVLENDE